MQRINVINVIAQCIMAYSVLVMVGWITGNIIWTSVFDDTVTMKFSTAIGFFCSGLIILLSNQSLQGRHKFSLTFLPAPCLFLALLMFSLIISLLVGIKTGVENLFVKEDVSAIFTIYPGRPSLVTLFNFVLILIAGFVVMLRPKGVKRYMLTIGLIVLLTGGIGLLGYMLHVPLLYNVIEGYSTAMAFNTAVMFVLNGTAFLMLGRVNR